MVKYLEVEDIAGKVPIEIDGVTFDMSATAVLKMGVGGDIDVDSLEVDDIVVLTDTGLRLSLEEWKIPLTMKKKIDAAIMAAALKLGEATPEYKWEEHEYVG